MTVDETALEMRSGDAAERAAIPYLQLSRISGEHHTSMCELIGEFLPSRWVESIVFELVARICAPDWVVGSVIAPPVEPVRSISINAIASSLDRSFETTRRHVRALLNDGWFTKVNNGIALSSAPEHADRIIRFYRIHHDLFVRYVEDIATTTDLTLPSVATATISPLDIITRTLDLALSSFGFYSPLTENWKALIIWSAIAAVNIRHRTYAPDLRHRSEERTPDENRRPVSLHPIASGLQIPYATAWRLIRIVEEAGMISRVGDKWVVLNENLDDALLRKAVVGQLDYSLRKVREVAMLGLAPARAADFYLVGRPALMPF